MVTGPLHSRQPKVDGSRTTGKVDAQRAIAERNVEAILDAAEDLLRRGGPMSLSAVAAAAGLSRPTVYAHFGDRSQLVAALVGRSVRRATVAMATAEPGRGDPRDALWRVIAMSWEQLAGHQEVARAAAGEITVDAVHAAHHDVGVVFGKLIRRGRAQGVFRTDLPVEWLVSSCMALIHAAAACVQSGQMSSGSATRALDITLADLCVAKTRRTKPQGPALTRRHPT